MSPRIVSLIASSTEILCSLGFEAQLVGRSHECDFPESVRKLPCCTEVKFKTDGSSYEIDERVKAILQEGLSVYKVSAEKLKALKPDLIVTQIQCEVCAVSEKDVEEAVCQILESRPKIVSLNTNALKDLWEDIRRVATALDAPERAEKLISDLKCRIAAIAKKGRAMAHKPTVACIEWMDPLMSAGNWMPELVERAGGINLFGEAGRHSPWMTWEQLVEKNPDIILILPCGFDLPRTRQEIHLLTGRLGWEGLSAVLKNQIYLLDGNQYFNRPGPRLVESLEILAEILHPNAFQFSHQGSGWQVL